MRDSHDGDLTMLLFRPPLQRFGRPGVTPPNFAAAGDAPSPLANDMPALADRAQAEWLWVLLSPLPASGTTAVDDSGGYELVGPANGAYTQQYRGLVMPLTGDAIVYDETISINVGTAAVQPTGIPSAEAFGAPTVIAAAGVTVSPAGIASGEAFGVPAVAGIAIHEIVVYGIPSAEAFGIPIVEDVSEDLDALITLAQADAYILDYHGANSPWFTNTTSLKKIAIRRAAQYLLTTYSICPEYLDPLHPNVLAACAEAALRASSLSLFTDVQPQYVEAVTVGPISKKMSAPRNSGQQRIAVVDALLRGLTCGTSGQVFLVRA